MTGNIHSYDYEFSSELSNSLNLSLVSKLPSKPLIYKLLSNAKFQSRFGQISSLRSVLSELLTRKYSEQICHFVLNTSENRGLDDLLDGTFVCWNGLNSLLSSNHGDKQLISYCQETRAENYLELLDHFVFHELARDLAYTSSHSNVLLNGSDRSCWSNLPNGLIRTPQWLELGQRLLDQKCLIILHLLKHNTMFMTLPSEVTSYIQICGMDLGDFELKKPARISKSSSGKTLSNFDDILLWKSTATPSRTPVFDSKYILSREYNPELLTRAIFPLEYGMELGFTGFNVNIDRTLKKPDYHVLDSTKVRHFGDALLKYLYEMSERHKQCDYWKVIDKYCPRNPSSIDQTTVTSSVVTMATELFHDIFPSKLFLSEDNLPRMCQIISKFIYMRANEKISLAYILNNFGLTIDGNMEIDESINRYRILAQMVFWVLRWWLIPLLHSVFFLRYKGTDINSLFYYRRDIWKTISSKVLRESNLEKIPARALPQVSSLSTLGTGRINILPKASSGYRVITNFSGKESVNSKLQGLLLALRVTRASNIRSSSACSSLTSIDSFLTKLRHFKQIHHNSKGGYLLTKIDLSKCFDNINTNKAELLAGELLSTFDSYEVFTLLSLGIKSFSQAVKDVRSVQRVSPGQNKWSHEILLDGVPTAPGRILIDPGRSAVQYRQTDMLIRDLHELLNGTRVRTGTGYSLLKQGIPQGSAVSTILCDIVLDKVEQVGIRYDPESSMLFRYVDDFLFLSTSRCEADNFLDVMLKGFPEYGVDINPHKTICNFVTSKIPSLIPAKTVQFLSWSIDCKFLDPLHITLGERSRQVSSGTGVTLEKNTTHIILQMKSKLKSIVAIAMRLAVTSFPWTSKNCWLTNIRNICSDVFNRMRTMSKLAGLNMNSQKIRQLKSELIQHILRLAGPVKLASQDEVFDLCLRSFRVHGFKKKHRK